MKISDGMSTFIFGSPVKIGASESDLLLLRTEVNWTHDILQRVNGILNSDMAESDKLHAIGWFTKQGLKGRPTED